MHRFDPASRSGSVRLTSGAGSFDVALGPELEAAMAEHRAEVDAIADRPWPPTFDDTIAALEASGTRLHVAERLLSYRASACSTPEIRALEAEMQPRLAAHADAVGMDQRVFARIADLVARRPELGLDAEQDAALERYHRDFVRAGATLGEDDRARLRAINERLSALTAAFRDNVQDETAALAVRVETAAELDGLPAPLVEAAAVDGGYVLRLALPSAQPVLEHLHDRGLRERLYRAAIARGRRGGPNDNRAVVCEMAALRAERAGLLGFGSHAEYAVAEQTAGSVAAVMEMLTAVGTAASPRRAPRPSATPRRCTPTGTPGRSSRGTGPTTPPASAAPATPSTTRACRSSSCSTASWTTGCSRSPATSTA